ncbi:MAG: TetR/AcrR family transcriptional regulator [Gammaproteobacteria bacterium]|nr:TetR/AcrR family transcriptional regulator [Gammaproteobacteria bacterium]
MSTKGKQNRERIVEAADNLFYHKGFNQTSFSEVADASGIPKGNFYYYFKSKDELLNAVIDSRIELFRNLLSECEANYQQPLERLYRVADILVNEADNVLHHGCPMGTLNAELGKTQEELKAHATQMFDLLVDWCEQQFMALGKGEESRFLAMHQLAMLQGAAMLSHVYNDRTFLEKEVQTVKSWLDSLLQ